MAQRMKKIEGFSLIELLIVLAIMGILAGVAYPAYTQHVQKSRRAEARSELLLLATRMERYFADYSTYIGANAQLNSGTSENGHYTITVAETATTYVLSAVPAGVQAADDCGTFTLNSNSQKGSGQSIQDCW